jgi:hypothetical protein
MKNKKLGIALLTVVIFTTIQARNDNDNRNDIGSSLLFLPTVAVDASVDTVTLNQTQQTRKYLDSRDSRNNSENKRKSSSQEQQSRRKARSKDNE